MSTQENLSLAARMNDRVEALARELERDKKVTKPIMEQLQGIIENLWELDALERRVQGQPRVPEGWRVV